ncbi:dihydroorotate dehydrogenase [Actibacterium pelagium]|uniref:Dihydroorotate dehydrogenase n=1 Tax=Actibacterium pelagium TaxID=2029103 RepID=A0A917ELD5_9RHOB|nr:dihydroorotate dehydrogenase [Actibacterium pelagium]GGE59770.1 hypothetical protein GCM10011517_29200 [Actibacterium pelagium]
MTDMEQKDPELEAFFEAGRAEAPVPSDDLIARILADAEAAPVSAAPTVSSSGGVFGALSSIWAEMGGWKTTIGLGFAGLVGVYIGYSDPTVTDTTASLFVGGYSYDVSDLALTASDLWAEG